MKKRILSFVLALASVAMLRADEGMWPLTMVAKLQDPMQAKGLKLTAEDIYSINNASLKDAVVRLMSKQGRMFCTGELISREGLFLTNHHCGYSAIQELSTPQDNILSNGFWAKNRSEERPANFNIGLLRKVEDVTDQVLNGIAINQDEATRAKAVSDATSKLRGSLLEALGADKPNFVVEVVAFWGGNRFLAMYYEVYRDIRLVGTPPENVGKFGGETDNWRWPRHTCDFSMFRIYADSANKPADMNANNKAYQPKKFFPISLKGTQQGDFAMIMGYPGRTTRYTYSEGVRYLGGKERPLRVQVRRDIMDVYEKYMKQDPNIRLMYSDKLAGLGNYWNKFNGEAGELSKPEMIEKRKNLEREFENWVKANGKQDVYGEVTSLYDEVYVGLNQYGLYPVYLQDGIANSQPMMFALQFSALTREAKDGKMGPDGTTMAKMMRGGLDDMFKEFYAPIEKEVLASVLRHLYEDLDHANLPITLTSLVTKYKRDYNKLAEYLWKSSMFSDKSKMDKFLSAPNLGKLFKDPIYAIVSGYNGKLNGELKPVYDQINAKKMRADRLFLAALSEMYPDKAMAPDANGTMRMTYGTVLNYDPKDGVEYKEFTTAKGYLEKYKAGDFEFDAPKSLLDLIRNKDYGQYADKDGELHTCFLTDNDITGGNSGSPVINGKGELIGTAFDGNWEAIASDFGFMPAVQRTISVDIRFTLFIMDKLGGASHLLNEMTIVK
jgi:hypothetical protein